MTRDGEPYLEYGYLCCFLLYWWFFSSSELGVFYFILFCLFFFPFAVDTTYSAPALFAVAPLFTQYTHRRYSSLLSCRGCARLSSLVSRLSFLSLTGTDRYSVALLSHGELARLELDMSFLGLLHTPIAEIRQHLRQVPVVGTAGGYVYG